MNSTQTSTNRWIRSSVLSLSLAGFAGLPYASAQTASSSPRPDANEVRTFHLNSDSSGRAPSDLEGTLRQILGGHSQVSLSRGSNTITVLATPDQMSIAEKVIAQLDKPGKDYRLTYTLSELDGTKLVGVQHFSLVLVSGERTTLKQGSKVPIATGATSDRAGASSTQFTYVDVGVNTDATLNDGAGGLRLQSKVEQSGVLSDKSIAGVVEPVIRQTVLEGSSILQPGKPVALGSLDVPGSTRHLDVEAVVEAIR